MFQTPQSRFTNATFQIAPASSLDRIYARAIGKDTPPEGRTFNGRITTSTPNNLVPFHRVTHRPTARVKACLMATCPSKRALSINNHMSYSQACSNHLPQIRFHAQPIRCTLQIAFDRINHFIHRLIQPLLRPRPVCIGPTAIASSTVTQVLGYTNHITTAEIAPSSQQGIQVSDLSTLRGFKSQWQKAYKG